MFITWEPLPSRYLKVNFDGSIRGRLGGVDFVIRRPISSLVVAGGCQLFKPLVLGVQL